MTIYDILEIKILGIDTLAWRGTYSGMGHEELKEKLVSGNK